MSWQPEALRLARALEQGDYLLSIERDKTASELRRLHGLTKEWERKAATWLASPEAAQRLDGYRELTQRLNACEQQRDALLAELHKARAALQEHLDELIKSHTHPDTGLITDDADLLIIESEQDLINSIDRAIAQAEGHAPT